MVKPELQATPIVRAVPISRRADHTVFDLHMACGHILVRALYGPNRNNPMYAWQAICWLCGNPDTAAQPDLFCEK